MLKIFIFVIFGTCLGANVRDRDNGRLLFRGAYTNTVIDTKTVTSLVPSSCVQVDATLPPCRNVRYLKFPTLPVIMNSFQTNSTENQTDHNQISTNSTEPRIETTPLGWGEYLGIFAPTVTVTKTEIHVETVQDPAVVVTYAIKGCKPVKLPIEIDICRNSDSSSISIEEILQTTTVPAPVVPTASILPTKTMSNLQSTVYDSGVNNNLLEGSVPEIKSNPQLKATRAL